jgi:hypothetical protein
VRSRQRCNFDRSFSHLGSLGLHQSLNSKTDLFSLNSSLPR